MEHLLFAEWFAQGLRLALQFSGGPLKPDRLINYNHDLRPISKKWHLREL